jgi:hypothetical protein
MLVKSDISYAGFAEHLPAILQKPRRAKGARQRGLVYERKATAYLYGRYLENYLALPWLEYRLHGEGRLQYAQPDGLLIDPIGGYITVVEIKYQHTVEAYWQTLGKYVPILSKIFPTALWKFKVVEVVKWYDPFVKFPAEVKLRSAVHRVLTGEFAVHIWKP